MTSTEDLDARVAQAIAKAFADENVTLQIADIVAARVLEKLQANDELRNNSIVACHCQKSITEISNDLKNSNDGEITAEELTVEQRLRIQDTFELFDADDGGSISTTEISLALAQLGQNCTEAELEAMLDEFDTDRSGEIDFAEFVQLVIALGVADIDMSDEGHMMGVATISHYGRDSLTRWLGDDGEDGHGDVTGPHVPVTQRTCRKIVMRRETELLVYLCIVLVAIMSGVENFYADRRNEFEAGSWPRTVEKGVLVIFVIELVVKVFAENYSRPYHYLWDPWNGFDSSVLISILVIELVGVDTDMSATRLLRLFRAIRVLRAIRFLPGLTVIVETLIHSLPSVGYISLVALIFQYIFAVVGVATFGRNDPFGFGNLGLSMISLFKLMTFDSWTQLMYWNMWGCDYIGADYEGVTGMPCENPEGHPISSVVFFGLYILIIAYLVFNLFVGVVTVEMEEAKKHSMKRLKMRSQFALASKMKQRDKKDRANLDEGMFANSLVFDNEELLQDADNEDGGIEFSSEGAVNAAWPLVG